jgi:SAM-dependent methyltransferase
MAAASKRLESAEKYQEFQRIQANLLLAYIRNQGITLANLDVLDLGCGHGGYSRVFEEEGARVVSSDLIIVPDLGLTAAVQADATNLPLDDHTFDFVFCASLIEHVEDSPALVREIHRVMKPGAKCYLSFPPFYTPIGGHQFKPFHLLGEKLALSLYKFANRREEAPSGATFEDAYGEWGLYRRTISGVRGDIEAASLTILDQSTRYLPVDFSRIPVLSEFLTWHVQFILEKRP